jgi:hypothetical protein
MLLNGLLLLFVVLTPYTTLLVANHLTDTKARAAAGIYSGTFFLMGIVWNGLWRYCAAGRRLLGSDITDEEASTITRQYLVAPLSAGAALAVSLLNGLASVVIVLAAATFFAITATIAKEE